jgi:hypothetical protein
LKESPDGDDAATLQDRLLIESAFEDMGPLWLRVVPGTVNLWSWHERFVEGGLKVRTDWRSEEYF